MTRTFLDVIGISTLLVAMPLSAASAANVAAKALGAPVLAADMVKAPPPAPPRVYSWTGFYIGDNAGYSWSKVTTSTSATCAAAASGYYCKAGNPNGLANIPAIDADGSGSFRNDAFTGGAQAGYNWQSGNWVVGLEADIEAYRAKVTTAVARIYPGNPRLTYVEGTNVTTDWLSTWRGRLGWAIDKVLVYGAGGVALTDLRVSDTFNDNDGAGAVGGSNISKLKAGWTVGAGVEYLLWRNWTIRGEYLYVDLGSVSTATTVTNPSFPGLSNPLSVTGKVTGSIGRAALNYRF